MQAKVANITEHGHRFVMIWLIRDRRGGGDSLCRLTLRRSLLPAKQKETSFSGTKTEVKRFPTSVQVGKHQGERTMKAAKTESKSQAADLVKKYRPLGLKAVLAAALQVKAKPAGSKFAKR